MFADKEAVHYKALKKKYDDYVNLYKFFNDGSTTGVTPFAEFYWRFNYYVKYEDATTIGVGNF